MESSVNIRERIWCSEDETTVKAGEGNISFNLPMRVSHKAELWWTGAAKNGRLTMVDCCRGLGEPVENQRERFEFSSKALGRMVLEKALGISE